MNWQNPAMAILNVNMVLYALESSIGDDITFTKVELETILRELNARIKYVTDNEWEMLCAQSQDGEVVHLCYKQFQNLMWYHHLVHVDREYWDALEVRNRVD